MTNFDRSLLLILCGVSVGVTLLLILLVVFGRLLRQRNATGERRKGISFLWVCLLLLISVWTLRYAVNYYLLRCPGSEDDRILTGFEQIFNSFVHALQTFSMDEGYTEYIRDGKAMMAALTGEGSFWESFYGCYASVLNMAAPIAGGAIIFEILTSFFPHVRLWFGALMPWKRLYFFSNLNERSLALAKSVLRDYDPKAMIVFADVDEAEDEGRDTDILERARVIGAVCVKTDLLHIRVRMHGQGMFFLIGEHELENLSMLLTLAKQDRQMILRNSEIYLFADDDYYERVEPQFREALRSHGYQEDKFVPQPDGKQKYVPGDFPLILPVQSYQNLVFNLLTKLPLTEPLVPDRRDLSPQVLQVTLLGIGRIGKEMLLDAYWCGQMLHCELVINVISCEPEEEFRAQLDALNPELLRSMAPGDPLLRINGKGDYSAPYCKLRYIQADLETESLQSVLDAAPEEGFPPLADAQYYVVAIGSDERNIQLASAVQRAVGRRNLEAAHAADGAESAMLRVLIAYAVYDAELCEMLNRNALQSSGSSEAHDVYLYAFGSIAEEFSVANIMMPDIVTGAEEMHHSYLRRAKDPERRVTLVKNRAKYYNMWANIARLTHIKYKMYGVGLRMPSVFTPESALRWDDTMDAYTALVTADRSAPSPEQLQKYRDLFVAGALPETADAYRQLLHDCSWLEHRRWNAFQRSRGYQHTDAAMQYYARTHDHKELRLRLHPCLVECDQRGMRDDLEKEIAACGGDAGKRAAFDLLDLLTYQLRYEEGVLSYDFKMYDYPDNYLEESKHYIRRFLQQ